MGASQNAVKIMFGFNPNSTTIVVFIFRDTNNGRRSETQTVKPPAGSGERLAIIPSPKTFSDSCRFVTDHARLHFCSTLMICRQRHQTRVASATRRPVGVIRRHFYLLQNRVTCFKNGTPGMVGWLRIGTSVCELGGYRCYLRAAVDEVLVVRAPEAEAGVPTPAAGVG